MAKTKFFFILLLFLFLIGCSKNDFIDWQTKMNGEVYDCVFLPGNKVILSTMMGVFCYDPDSGKQKWKTKEIVTLYKPILMKESLITGNFGKSGLFSISIKDGKVEELFNTKERVHAVQVQDEKNILAVTQDVVTERYVLRRFDIEDRVIEKIVDLDSRPKCKFEFHGENIVLSAVHNGEKDKLFIIDLINNTIKWEDTIGNGTLLYNSDFVCIENSIYYVKYDVDGNYLLQVDINSGTIIDCISFPFLVSSNYLRLYLDDILICGRSFYYIFDTVNRHFDKVMENRGDLGYTSFVSNDNIFFDNGESIYCYSIRDKMQRKLYELKGKELFMMFGNTTSIILIVAKDIKKSLGNSSIIT